MKKAADAGSLSRQSHEPLYEQLAARLAHQIASGELAPGAALESEARLIARYGVSRITVRQAIGVLRKQGRLTSRRGKGTFVAEKVLTQRLDTLQGFYDSLRSQGLEPEMRLLEFSDDAGSSDLSRPSKADLPVRLKRLYLIERQPFALVIGYLPAAARGIGFRGAERAAVYEILRQRLGVPIGRAEVTIRCQRPPPDVSKLFNLKRSDFMLVMDRQSFSPDHAVCEAMRIYIVPERYEFSLQVAGAIDLARGVQPVEFNDRSAAHKVLVST